ncbi:hypothetical protein, partial [Streptomyces silvensis]|uniref:hypothetical protein n=1 Tax=Streptomyces silvensis TaxID=1765722 RepID=UPI001A7E09C2
ILSPLLKTKARILNRIRAFVMPGPVPRGCPYRHPVPSVWGSCEEWFGREELRGLVFHLSLCGHVDKTLK